MNFFLYYSRQEHGSQGQIISVFILLGSCAWTVQPLSLCVSGITLQILSIDEGEVLTTGVGLFKQSMNANHMTLVIFVSVNRETVDHKCPRSGHQIPFKMKYIPVEDGESMKHGFIWEWLSVVHSFWGLFKYFTSPCWNFKSYEVKFKEWSSFLLYWNWLLWENEKHSVITSITTRWQYCYRLIPLWPFCLTGQQ